MSDVSDDISPILQRWPWDPRKTVRRIVGADGIERVQIRICLHTYHGILQFDCDGRPDGETPYGVEFAFDHFETLAAENPALRLNKKQAQELINEAIMVYQRYVVLFQMGDYSRVIRDTERNMQLFRFVHERAERVKDQNWLEKWWPYILRIHFTSQAMICLGNDDLVGATGAVETALDQIEALEELSDEVFAHERSRSVGALTELKDQIEKRRPLSEIEVLERMKMRAALQEDYEMAARLRDQIARLRDGQPNGIDSPGLDS